MPFYKVKIEKQLDILKAFTVLREKGTSVSYKDVAPLAGIKSETNVSACLKFWHSIGLLEREGKGYKASDIIVDFFKKLEWGDEDSAWSLMRDRLAKTWFGESVISAFKVRSYLSEDDLINVLSSASGVTELDSTTRSSLKAIVKILEMVKIVIRDEEGFFKLNQELVKGLRDKEFNLPKDKDAIKITIGEESFIIDIEALEDFVRKHGKRLAKEEIKLE
ncbi:hypothetical protein J7L18_02090 [Candidatus Bathyarchaeota archaeon]|nr:hypothetical protein [Candidatus Bathyarchaeota archaeon]